MTLTSNQSQAVLEYFNNDAQVLCFLLDIDGVVLSANRYTQNLLGLSVLGCKFEDILVDFQRSFKLENYTSVDTDDSLLSLKIPNSEPRSYYFSFRKADDSVLVFGKSDEEELELLRSQLTTSNNELNNLTRTLHKKNAQLDHLNKVKNQFLGMAAHDLRKPISIILNYAEFLLDEAGEQLDEEQIGFLNTIEGSAEFMKRLVDDFLDVSAIESGQFKLNMAEHSPSEILERSLVLARIHARKKAVELEVSVGLNLPEIPMDADKLEQALSNLLGNAIEHSSSGASVNVILEEIDGSIFFRIKDQGVGMKKEAMEKLFLPFSKAGSVKTGGEKSTGLGLTITHKIIEAHLGELFVESEEGKGSAFTIALSSEVLHNYNNWGNNG